jgi:SAM-dependent methyltransferase
MNVSAPPGLCADSCYDLLAPHYDRYTEHPSYSSWVRRLEALARRHGLTGRRALDVGCGTGKSILPLRELGYEVVGCDPSPEMLERATAKLAPGVALYPGGLPDLPVPGPFDYVSCLNDVLNYVGPEDLMPAFAALAAVLRRGGILVADSSTLAMYRTFFARDHVRTREEDVFVWRAATPPDADAGSVARGELDIFTRSGDGRYERLHSEDVQQHHPEAVLQAAIEAAGLEVVGAYGQCDDGHPEEPLDPTRHTKCIWVVRRP